MDKEIIDKIESELKNIYYGDIKLIVKKGKIEFIESKKSIYVK